MASRGAGRVEALQDVIAALDVIALELVPLATRDCSELEILGVLVSNIDFWRGRLCQPGSYPGLAGAPIAKAAPVYRNGDAATRRSSYPTEGRCTDG